MSRAKEFLNILETSEVPLVRSNYKIVYVKKLITALKKSGISVASYDDYGVYVSPNDLEKAREILKGFRND